MFDITDNNRVGFAPSHCDYSDLIGSTLLGGSVSAFGTKSTSSGYGEDKMIVEGGDVCYGSICGYHVAILFVCLVVALVARDRYGAYRERCVFERAEILSLSELCVPSESEEQRQGPIVQMRDMEGTREIT